VASGAGSRWGWDLGTKEGVAVALGLHGGPTEAMESGGHRRLGVVEVSAAHGSHCHAPEDTRQR
jgi:hypothetical protein